MGDINKYIVKEIDYDTIVESIYEQGESENNLSLSILLHDGNTLYIEYKYFFWECDENDFDKGFAKAPHYVFMIEQCYLENEDKDNYLYDTKVVINERDILRMLK